MQQVVGVKFTSQVICRPSGVPEIAMQVPPPVASVGYCAQGMVDLVLWSTCDKNESTAFTEQ